MAYTEAEYKGVVLELFRERLGYRVVYGPAVERDVRNPLYMEERVGGVGSVSDSKTKALWEKRRPRRLVSCEG